ncbi:putative CDP-diacylglycerol--glycerol-3-phosphate 3-phosphatidyltransferase [Convolutriloba macropyga]|uniref:putative CDP-diacylglycerol--glycerol-3-phosphate 3-phosphatidyltransferase n=1 Tax=Convolutriloba macropyga TaxID=536237 RepID=UPI003F52472D
MKFGDYVFEINANNVEVLQSPGEYYNAILSNIEAARSRIALSSLYLGTEPKSEMIPRMIGQKQKENSSLIVDLLFDYNRSMRLKQTTEMLANYINLNVANCYLYHSSYLNRHKKSLAPKRWNEIFGVLHIKSYIFDDVCILSGANLSEEYFDNRQDRYVVIRNQKLCDFMHELIRTIQQFSFRLNQDGSTSLKSTISLPWKQPQRFRRQSSVILRKYMDETEFNRKNQKTDEHEFSSDTTIEAFLQAPEQKIDTYSRSIEPFMESILPSEKLYVASGYFNLSNSLTNAMLACKAKSVDILACSRECNGFKTAKGPAGYVPDMYECVLHKFVQRLEERKSKKCDFSIYEYYRQKWTYHAKGMWIFSPLPQEAKNQNQNTLRCTSTLIGSANFGMRSQFRDLELQFLIRTKNEQLQLKLDQERINLFNFGRMFESRNVKYPLFMPMLSRMIKSFF